MDFLKSVEKDLEKSGMHVGASEPPRYWFSTGNYVLNKLISGSFLKGVPQGRLISFTGPSGAGKSFLAGSTLREAQKAGAHCVVLDSENALDDDFVRGIGVDPDNNYTYIPVDTIPEVKKVVAAFLTGYKKEYGNSDPDAPKVHFVIDSLDMLLTATEEEQFEKGITKGDQGQRNKQLKAMLRSFVQAVKHPNITMVVTSQVYKNQDVTNGEGVWVVSDAVKFSLSQIVMLTKLKLKNKAKTEVTGIRMKVEGYKTRFTKPFQTATIEVPYDEGMDPYNGLLEVALSMGIITNRGAWYYFGEEKWNGKELPANYAAEVLVQCEAKSKTFLTAVLEEDEEDNPSSKEPSAKAKRIAKALAGED